MWLICSIYILCSDLSGSWWKASYSSRQYQERKPAWSWCIWLCFQRNLQTSWV